MSFEEFQNGHLAAILDIRRKEKLILNLHVALYPDASHQVSVQPGIP